MKKKIKKSTTLDDLAIMVAGGFDRVDRRLDGMDKRMKGLEDGQEQIKLRLDNVVYPHTY